MRKEKAEGRRRRRIERKNRDMFDDGTAEERIE